MDMKSHFIAITLWRCSGAAIAARRQMASAFTSRCRSRDRGVPSVLTRYYSQLHRASSILIQLKNYLGPVPPNTSLSAC